MDGASARWRAEYDYEASDATEVSLAEGDVVVAVEHAQDGWVVGTVVSTGARGMMPANYIVEAEPVKLFQRMLREFVRDLGSREAPGWQHIYSTRSPMHAHPLIRA